MFTYFQEAFDCFCAAVPDAGKKGMFAEQIASLLNITSTEAASYCKHYSPKVEITPHYVHVGERVNMKKQIRETLNLLDTSKKKDSTFSFTRVSCTLLERIGVAVENREPILIVGETGTGKTTAVQYLAKQINQKLKVINMNQQSDSTDLLGSYKPTDIKTIMFPLFEQFLGVFKASFPDSSSNYIKYIEQFFSNKNWPRLIKLLVEGGKKVVAKLESDMKSTSAKRSQFKTLLEKHGGRLESLKVVATKDVKNLLKKEITAYNENVKDVARLKDLLQRWSKLRKPLEQAQGYVTRTQSAMAFTFMEGALTRAIIEGNVN